MVVYSGTGVHQVPCFPRLTSVNGRKREIIPFSTQSILRMESTATLGKIFKIAINIEILLGIFQTYRTWIVGIKMKKKHT